MRVDIEDSWKKILKQEFDKLYFKELSSFVETEYQHFSCYPPQQDIFKAFNSCHFNALKVVIIGQDPYHGEGQANGLCFSVSKDTPLPPSLKNIFKELVEDVPVSLPTHGDLNAWAKQGVLLLNATLTVRANQAGSHQKKGWEKFTDETIKQISKNKEGVVFLLWGGYAKKKKNLINLDKHFVLTSGHPSPLSANRGYWFGNKHFSKTNEVLISTNRSAIDWQLL